jgi:signal transduction histidine kinase
MSLSNVAFIRSTALLLLAGLAVLLFIVGLTFWLSVRTSQISDDITATRRLRASTVELRSILADAETGQRGFLLTHDSDYLKPYENAQKRLPPGMKLLTERATEAERPNVEHLDKLVIEKMAELAETISLERMGRSADALARVRTDRGRLVMDEARTLLAGMIERADERLVSSMTEQASVILNLQRAVLAGAALIILVVGASAIIALRYTRELVTARAELATLNRDLEQRVADRTADLGRANQELQRFAYIIGHDLRAPLVNVMGFTSELMEVRKEIFATIAGLREQAGVKPSPEHAEAEKDFDESIQFIRTSTTKMDGLINAILKLSREGKRPLTPERLDMTKLIGDAAANVSHRVLERGGEVRIEGELPSVVSDRFSLEQVFGNLFDNAAKYAHPARPPEIVARGRIEGSDAVFDLSDNGRGIAPGDHERVFELFRRVGQQDQQGEGIGLAAVRALVRRLGGDITVTSELGKGSTFHVRLPRVFVAEPGTA